MDFKRIKRTFVLGAALGLGFFQAQGAERPVLRLGHFPNITHAQAVIAQADGRYEKALGGPIEWKTFNAGPAAMEALMAGAIDACYVGPNPAINAYMRTDGQVLRIVAGTASGGASLVVRSDSGIRTDKDFNNRKITTPQLGNTQDVAAREWLGGHGYRLREKGGSVTILPIPNPDQYLLFKKREVDAAWVPEPWATRLIQEANCRRFLDERDLWPDRKFCVAHLVVRTDFLVKNPELVKRLIASHVEVTLWIRSNPEAARKIVNEEIGRETGKPLPKELIDESWKWFEVTYDPVSSSLVRAADSAYRLGFLGKAKPDLSGIYELKLLNEALAEKNLPPVK